MGDVETDRALVERVRKGDNRAFDLLVRKYQHKIIGLVSRYVRDWSECEDVAQEAFIRAYRAIGSFRGDSAFYTWRYKSAVNTAKNHLVAQGRRPPAEDIDADTAVQFDAGARLRDVLAFTPVVHVTRNQADDLVLVFAHQQVKSPVVAFAHALDQSTIGFHIAHAGGTPYGAGRDVRTGMTAPLARKFKRLGHPAIPEIVLILRLGRSPAGSSVTGGRGRR